MGMMDIITTSQISMQLAVKKSCKNGTRMYSKYFWLGSRFRNPKNKIKTVRFTQICSTT